MHVARPLASWQLCVATFGNKRREPEEEEEEEEEEMLKKKKNRRRRRRRNKEEEHAEAEMPTSIDRRRMHGWIDERTNGRTKGRMDGYRETGK